MLLFGEAIDVREEDEFLLLCARPSLNAQERQRVAELLRGGVDDGYLTARARFHKIIPLLYTCVQQLPDAPVSAAFTDGLRRLFHTNALRNVGLESTLVAVTSALAEAQITSLALKGPALARMAYGDCALRQSVDLDILVPLDDAARAWEVANASPAEDCAHDARPLSPACLRFASHFALEYGERSTPVEVHWRVSDSFFWLPFNSNNVFAHAVEIPLSDGSVRTPRPEDTLLLLAIHGASHCWERLGWIADISALAAHPGFDWSMVLAEARRQHVERLLALALLLAGELLGSELPGSVIEWLSGLRPARELAQQTARNLLASPSRILQGGQRVRFFANTRDTSGARLRFLAHRVFAPGERDWRLFDAAPAFHFVYWLGRPFRLLRDAITRSGS